MRILRLDPSHAGAYRALMLEAYTQHPDAFTSSADERAHLPLLWWQARLSPDDLPKEIVFGALADDGQLLGAVGLAFEPREKVRHKAALFGMVVRAAHRQQGLGAQLLDAALAHAQTRAGLALVQLTVTESNLAARRLYERHGFVAFGLEPMAVAVPGGYVAKRHMWHRLAPVRRKLPSLFNLTSAPPMTTLPDLPCYLNGEYTTLPHARISVMDRGFIFGDGVYEVAPVYQGRLFRFENHMARLERSLKELRIPNPFTRAQWADIALKLIATYADSVSANVQNIDQLIYLQISRGVAMRDHVMPQGLTPTVFVMTNGMKPPSAEQRAQGVACVTADDFRWEKAHIKATSLLGAVFARQISFDAGAIETVMFRHGYLSEAAACNVWIVKDGQVLGTPKDNLVLEGIRYGLIEEICQTQGIDFALRRISRAEVLAADEILLTSATKEVLPVTQLDAQPVGSGQPGPVYARLYAGYQAAKAQALQAPTGD